VNFNRVAFSARAELNKALGMDVSDFLHDLLFYLGTFKKVLKLIAVSVNKILNAMVSRIIA